MPCGGRFALRSPRRSTSPGRRRCCRASVRICARGTSRRRRFTLTRGNDPRVSAANEPRGNEKAAASPTFWRDRPVFVTGATGLLGGAVVRHLVDAGADVVCLVRDWVPRSEIVASGLIDRVGVVRGDVTDQDTIERAL